MLRFAGHPERVNGAQASKPGAADEFYEALYRHGSNISRADLLARVDMSGLLEEGEDPGYYLDEAESIFALSTPGGVAAAGFRSAGAFFIFTRSGHLPERWGCEGRIEALGQLSLDANAWVLLPINCPLAHLSPGETETLKLSTERFRVLASDQGNFRFQRLKDGEVIAALLVHEGVSKTVYTHHEHRREGHASMLWHLACQWVPGLTHSQVQTAHGKAWAQRIKAPGAGQSEHQADALCAPQSIQM